MISISAGAPLRKKKYNGAQRIAYTAIIVMGLGSVLTGLAIYKPVQFYWLCALLGGYETARIIHFILTIGYCLFFVIHIVQVILAGWDNFRSMVTGFSVVKIGPPANQGIDARPSIDHALETYAPISSATEANLPAHQATNANPLTDQQIRDNALTDQPAEIDAPAVQATGGNAFTDQPTGPILPEAKPLEAKPAGTDAPEANRPAKLPTGASPHFFRRFFGSAFGRSETLTVNQQIQRRTIVSLSVFALLGGAAWKSWFWLKDQGLKEGVQEPLRKGLNADEKIFRSTLSPDHQVRTYPPSAAAKRPRVNGNVGVGTAGFDPNTWRLQVTRAGGSAVVESDNFFVTIDELQKLPKTEIIFDFKCIEGWSQVSHWGGVKFSDFMQHYGLAKEAALSYAGFLTPDKDYYVGIDMPSALHPQTLLCYEMNGAPLPMEHGAPLRLIIPVKYGVKNLKRIGSVYFSKDRPDDYWFERGYDYYSGL
jgi:hypothetical protein